jgi:hypothetical protein
MKGIIVGIILIIAGINNIDAQTYNPEKAAEYARFWCNKRNTYYSPYFDQNKWGEMDEMLLCKIEELTLYIIELQKQIQELKKANEKGGER